MQAFFSILEIKANCGNFWDFGYSIMLSGVRYSDSINAAILIFQHLNPFWL